MQSWDEDGKADLMVPEKRSIQEIAYVIIAAGGCNVFEVMPTKLYQYYLKSNIDTLINATQFLFFYSFT